MKPKVLYIMSSYNIFSGTPKKTLDLAKFYQESAVIYVYNNNYSEFKYLFEETGAKIYSGFYGKNYIKHYLRLKKILKREAIDVVQTQFSVGEFLGYLIKIIDPKIRLIVAFVGALESKKQHVFFLKTIYKKVDHFVYISEYVKTVKEKQFPILKRKASSIIYNGTQKREDSGEDIINMKGFSILAVSGLIEIKNIQILIEAMQTLVFKKHQKDIFLYVAGDGPIKQKLVNLITDFGLQDHVFLMGYQKNIGRLINECNIFAHPCYKEGFGIAVAEAMIAEKPIIIANAGALPELIETEKTGLVVDPFISNQWAEAILRYKNDADFSKTMALNAKLKAQVDFSSHSFAENYYKLYVELTSNSE